MKRLVFLCILFLVPTTSATALPGGPSDLELIQNHGLLVLAWKAPLDWSPDEYRVFIDGKLAAATNNTSYIVSKAFAYAVQAVGSDKESAPALLVMSQQDGPTEGGPADCSYITTSIEPDNPPFIHPRVHDYCFEWIWELIKDERIPDGLNIGVIVGRDQ